MITYLEIEKEANRLFKHGEIKLLKRPRWIILKCGIHHVEIRDFVKNKDMDEFTAKFLEPALKLLAEKCSSTLKA